MRIAGMAQVLTVVLLAACSGDRLTNVGKVQPPPPQRSTFEGGPLLDHSGNPAAELTVAAINEPGVVAGSLTDGSPQIATIWTPPDYKPTALPLPGDTGISMATHIANDGTVLGKICDSLSQHCHWVTWKNGTITAVTPEGDVTDICPCDGQVLVGGLMVNGNEHAVIWTHGKLLDVGVPPGFQAAAFTAVNEGFMAGSAAGNRPSPVPFRWSPQFGFQMLPTIGDAVDVNASGTVLVDDDNVYPLGGPPIPFPRESEFGDFFFGTAINDSGWVAGVYELRADDAEPPPQAGAWKIGTNTVLPVSAGFYSQGLDINNAGFEIGQGSENSTAGWVVSIYAGLP